MINAGIQYNQYPLPLQGIGMRTADLDYHLDVALETLKHNLRVATPAQILSYSPERKTATVQPLVREKLVDRLTGTIGWVDLPTIEDVPVIFPQGGGYVLSFPLSAGDEVLLVFNDSCIDSWWTRGGIQNWNDKRRHDLSDAVVLAGLNNSQSVPVNLATDKVQLRTIDNGSSISIDDNGHIEASNGSGTLIIDDGKIEISFGSSAVTVNAAGVNIDGVFTINNNPYLLHTHDGVQSGAGVSAGVTLGT